MQSFSPPSGILHFTDVHSNDYMGQREAQGLQPRVQGLSPSQDGHYPPDSMIRGILFLRLPFILIYVQSQSGM